MDDPPYYLNENQLWEILRNFPKVTNGPFEICLGMDNIIIGTKGKYFEIEGQFVKAQPSCYAHRKKTF